MSVEAVEGKIRGRSNGAQGNLSPVEVYGEVIQSGRRQITIFDCARFDRKEGLCRPLPGESSLTDQPATVAPCRIIEVFGLPRYERADDEREGYVLSSQIENATLEITSRDPRMLLINDSPLRLTEQLSRYAESLLRANGKPLSIEQLYLDAHPDEKYLPPKYKGSVQEQLSILSSKLKESGYDCIQNIRNVGYRIAVIEPENGGEEEASSKLEIETIEGRVSVDKDVPQVVTVRDKTIPVSHQEFLLLQRLLREGGETVPYHQLFETLHPGEPIPQFFEDLIRQDLFGLRKKLATSGGTNFIKTVWGKGLRMNTPITPESEHKRQD